MPQKYDGPISEGVKKKSQTGWAGLYRSAPPGQNRPALGKFFDVHDLDLRAERIEVQDRLGRGVRFNVSNVVVLWAKLDTMAAAAFKVSNVSEMERPGMGT